MTESDDRLNTSKARERRAKKAKESDDEAIFSLAEWGMEKHFLIHSGKRAENSIKGWPRVMARDNDTRALSKLHLLASEVLKSEGDQFEAMPKDDDPKNVIDHSPTAMGFVNYRPPPENYLLKRTPLGQRVLDILRLDYHAMKVQYPNHRMSVIYDVFVKVTNALPEFVLDDFVAVSSPNRMKTEHAMRFIASKLNVVVDFLRLRWRGVAEAYANFCRSPIENYNGFLDDIDALCAANKKLMVLHIDLHERPASDSTVEHEESWPPDRPLTADISTSILESDKALHPQNELADAELIVRLAAMKKARTAFQVEVNRRFKKRLRGYGWCLEFGTRRAWHYHYLIFLKPNGKDEDDVELVEELGAFWLDKKKGGDYYPVNAHKDDYDFLAAGLVETSNPDVLKGLKHKVGYMTLTGLFVQTLLPAASRGFGRGGFDDAVPKPPRSEWRKLATWQAVRRQFKWI